MRRSFFYITVIAALFTGIAAKAQAQQTPVAAPENLHGYWAAPDCGHVEEVLVVSASTFLFVTNETLRLSSVHAGGVESNSTIDYNVLEIDGAPSPVSRTEDGILALGEMDGAAPPARWPATWQELPLLAGHEYAGCHEMPPLLPAPADLIMKYIDGLHTRCGQSLTKSCRTHLFRLADRDKNDVLDITEMQDAGGLLVLLASLLEHKNLRRDDLLHAYESARQESRITAHIMMAKSDTDRSGTLDRHEVMQTDFTALPATLRAAQATAGKTFAGLRGE